MYKQQQALQTLVQQKILPLYFNESASVSAGVLQALYHAGVRMVEYTNRGEAALDNFHHLKALAARSMDGLLLGIGTIKSAAEAQAFMQAGADFIVCPTINTEVGAIVQANGLLWVPGCMTPTEMATAATAGAHLVKLFPGNLLGPSFVQAVRELFPGLLLMPTGGVEISEDNLKTWFQSGVAAVGLGSKLITKELMEQKNYSALEAATRQALHLVAGCA